MKYYIIFLTLICSLIIGCDSKQPDATEVTETEVITPIEDQSADMDTAQTGDAAATTTIVVEEISEKKD